MRLTTLNHIFKIPICVHLWLTCKQSPRGCYDAAMAELDVTPEMVLRAYCCGAFPMADARDGELGWYAADPRGVLPMGRSAGEPAFHVPRSLAKLMRREPFALTIDRAFEQVIAGCADRDETWINDDIIRLYTQLHRMGYGHSVEAWRDGQLVAGVYGLAIGAAFFGESMFSRVPNASKVCLVHLATRLREHGCLLFDAQFHNPHLEQFGLIEVPAAAYMRMLETALAGGMSGVWCA